MIDARLRHRTETQTFPGRSYVICIPKVGVLLTAWSRLYLREVPLGWCCITLTSSDLCSDIQLVSMTSCSASGSYKETAIPYPTSKASSGSRQASRSTNSAICAPTLAALLKVRYFPSVFGGQEWSRPVSLELQLAAPEVAISWLPRPAPPLLLDQAAVRPGARPRPSLPQQLRRSVFLSTHTITKHCQDGFSPQAPPSTSLLSQLWWAMSSTRRCSSRQPSWTLRRSSRIATLRLLASRAVLH